VKGGPFVLIISAGSGPAEMQSALERAGIKVEVARTDDPWLLLDPDTEPTLIVLDLAAMENTESDLLRILQAHHRDRTIPVITISNLADLASKVRALENGAVDYLTTPLLLPELVARVKTQLRHQRDLESMAEAHEHHLQLLAGAQKFCMPQPQQMPSAKFEVIFQQVHMAGGDFYDVMDPGDGRVDYVVADASGHDLSASYWTLSLKTLLSEYLNLRFSPVDALYLINRSLIRLLPAEVFFTTAYLRVDRAAGRVLLLNGGHPPMVYLTAGNGAARIIEQTSDVVGCFSDAKFAGLEMNVMPGDRLFLLSDGLIECCGTATVGLTKLAKDLERLHGESLHDQVAEAFANQLRDCPPGDDALLMGVEI
jgi:sigma-B regulation protein RsbU (phosphoserine phosphatase)